MIFVFIFSLHNSLIKWIYEKLTLIFLSEKNMLPYLNCLIFISKY